MSISMQEFGELVLLNEIHCNKRKEINLKMLNLAPRHSTSKSNHFQMIDIFLVKSCSEVS